MKRNFSLFVLAISLSAADPQVRCGTVPGVETGARLSHIQNVRLRTARKVRLAERVTPARTAGDLIVMDAGGGILGQRNPFNLDRQVVRFTPQAGGYRFVTEPGEVEELTAQSTPLANLGDDDSREVALPFPFPFEGQTYNRFFVNSDGNVTFGRADGGTSVRSLGRFTAGPPRIAVLFTDLDPSNSGQVLTLSSSERMVITWSRVPEYRAAGTGLPNTFQIRLYRDGRVELAYGGVNALEAVVGLSKGEVASPAQVVSFLNGPLDLYPGSVAESFTLGDVLDLVTLAQRFYTQFDDTYDYLVVYNTMGLSAGAGVVAFEMTVRNDRTGYGDVPANTGAEYGSKQRLLAVLNLGPTSQYPVDPLGLVPSRGGAGDTPLSIIGHEAGHLFLAYASVRDPGQPEARPMLGVQQAHWNFNFNSEASLLEGNRIRDNGPTASPRFETTATVEGYAPLDQYLMGLRAPEEVPPTFLVTGSSLGSGTRAPQRGVRFDGRRRDIAIDEIIQAEGRRTPDSTVAQRHFRFAFIVLTAEGAEPTAEQLAQVERYRADFPDYFARVTDRRATAETRILKAVRFRAGAAVGVLEGQVVQAQIELDRPLPTPLVLRPRAINGTVSLPESITIPAGATSTTLAIRGVRPGATEIFLDPDLPGFETGRINAQTSPAVSALHLRILEGERIIPREGDPPAAVRARVVDLNDVPYPGLEVTAGGSAMISDAAGEVRFTWSPGRTFELRITGGSSATVRAFYAPIVYDGGVINAAFRDNSLQGLSPGGVASIYGIDLATSLPAQSSSGVVSLGETQVTVGGRAARLLYVSDTQINFVMPAALAPGVHTLTVTTPAGTSEPKRIALDTAWPGLFAARVTDNTIELDVTGLGAAGTAVNILVGDFVFALARSPGSADVVHLPVPLPPDLHGTVAVRVEAAGKLSNSLNVTLP